MKKGLFALYQKLVNLLWGSGLGKIPPVYWIYSTIFQLLRPGKGIMEVGGNKMFSGLDGLPSSFNRTFQAYIVKGSWEEETTRLFKQYTKVGDTVIDVGANIGYYTLLAAKIVGNKGIVYAFEPDPNNYKLLNANIELNGYSNVVSIQKAVSDKNDVVELYLNDNDVGAHTIYKPSKSKKSVKVVSVIIDDYFKGKEYPVNIVKMDIEGAEMAALSGMKNIIKANPDIKIFVEFHIPWIIRSGASPDYYISQLLDDYKFSITVIEDYTKHIKSERVKTKDELLSICHNTKVVNLLLERARD